jgi:hypothetical protein
MMARSLRALLANLIDYAGLYPPAALPLQEVVANYARYLRSPEAWMLNRLVLPLDKLHDVSLGDNWRVTLLVDGEPGPMPPQVETFETKTGRLLSLATYCEVPLDKIDGAYAKIRTGGSAPPTVETLADFLSSAATRRIPFKATAGLHHPITMVKHASACPSTTYGFLNVFVAATFAHLGLDQSSLASLLNETDSNAFEFGDNELRWRDCKASLEQVQIARRDFAHSFGSCSFAEPIEGLRTLGLLK